MPTPSFNRGVSQSTFVFPATCSMTRFFFGTTEETTSMSISRRLMKRRRNAALNLAVPSRVGRPIRARVANVSFVNELLISINTYLDTRATRAMQTRNRSPRQASVPYHPFGAYPACDTLPPHVASPCEKIGASPTPFTAFPCSAKSRPGDTTKRI